MEQVGRRPAVVRKSTGEAALQAAAGGFVGLCCWAGAGMVTGADTGGVGGDRIDFFVSHAGADRAWAEWVAWQLADAGYGVELDVWDWAAGRNFVTAMCDALDRCDRVVALFSAAYLDRSRYTTGEWSAAVVHVLGRGEGRLVP